MSEVLIGIGGYAGAGKDTLADLLVEHFSFVKIAFADPMREIASVINPVVGFIDATDSKECEVVRYNDAVEMLGYNMAKTIYPEIRQFLQRLGTEAGRNVLGTDIWVNDAMRRAKPHRRVVFPDMRFQNEAHVIRSANGRTVRVERHDVEVLNSHVSEHDLNGWAYDLFIHNNSAPIDMLTRMEQFFARSYTQVLRTS